MTQLFSRSANSVVRAVLILGAAAFLAVPVGIWAFARTPTATGQFRLVKQPIPFNHPVHVSLRIDCRYCHFGAERTASAGLPPTRACVGCHNEQWLTSALFQPVRVSIVTGQPIRWRRVTSVPDFVFFNHAVHTRRGVPCETCHGRVEQMDRVYQVAPLTMSWCVACHQQRHAPTTCTTCHR